MVVVVAGEDVERDAGEQLAQRRQRIGEPGADRPCKVGVGGLARADLVE
jgi:hypothetical protein